MPALYGIIGYPLSHSFSPAYFKKKFAELAIDATYEAFPLPDIAEYRALAGNHPDLCGLNVTIPYKELIIPFLDSLDPIAAEVGAVNTVRFRHGYTTGYNTDVIGFEQSLIPELQPWHTQALILGTGGSSRAVAHVLRQLRIPFLLVSRTAQAGCITYSDLTPEIVARHRLIVNTTSLGMYPNIEGAPSIPYEAIGQQHLLYDLIYNPEESRFLALGRANEAVTKNGFEMLQLQAEASWQIWTGQMRPDR